MKRTIVATLAALLAGAAIAQPVRHAEPPPGGMAQPLITALRVDWQAAASTLDSAPGATPAQAFAPRNAAADARFPGIAKSAVPVLLPFDIDGYRKALRTARIANPDQQPNADDFVLGGFHASRFFLAGPAGYDAAFSLRVAGVPGLTDIDYRKPVHLLMSGFSMLYDLGGPPLPEGDLVNDLQNKFPGIRRYFFESYVRYVFRRYGVVYAVATYCQDRPPRARYLTCRQSDRIIKRFLDALHLVGGTPAPARTAIAPPPIKRPQQVSPDFSYFSPGFLIPGTGLKPDLGGRADYTVYGDLRFPLKNAPDFANSQSFNNWGNCDTTGRSPRHLGRKGMHYTCKVNGRRLVFDESAGRNYSYPWRDNFCEHRHFFAGQCPGGQGHQGQDIRPSYCKMFNAGADRCLPYQHDVVAPADSMVLRARKHEALLFFLDTPNAHLRVRYMHMSPKRMDAAGLLSGRQVKRGEDIGQVGNYNDFAGGTTYHLHFDLQVPTEVGWSLVNPYMTLVAAYERLLGARGTEIRPGDSVPAIAAVPPVVGHPDYDAKADGIALPPARPAAANAVVELPTPKPRMTKKARARQHRHHRRKARRLSRE
ncbi:MAG: peptidoglycan DD-metalloendopeptidase family protein [Pseudolabrys sp.]